MKLVTKARIVRMNTMTIRDINSHLQINLDNRLEIHFNMSRVTIQGSKPARHFRS